ncbi:hypothetical protein AbraCBS73388_003232 [Aspergillus brasiliensis]|uniref:Uncharacterized protein n=1 Tax=Aspergillus brasiliensis TaxID=319629 RepID=A0A9W5Z207_9EURO|nr:hypothetical protein AbraCBS73388_003232 [Aspergillus brasiliensis]
MPILDAIREALVARTAGPNNETSLADNSRDAQKDCNKTEEILESLGAIRAQLEIQNHELAFLRSKFDSLQTPELPPRLEDWSDQLFARWYHLRYPSQARLDQVQETFKVELRAHNGRLYISVPNLAIPLKKVVTARAAPDIAFLDLPTPRERGILDATTMPLLLSAWPASLVSELDVSGINNNDSQRLLEFQWALPEAKEQKFEIEVCEMSYDAEGKPKYGKRFHRMVGGILDERSTENQTSDVDNVPWSGKVCGRVVQISLRSTMVMSMKAIGFALWQLQHPEISDTHPLPGAPEATRFIVSFASPWGTLPHSYSKVNFSSVFLQFQARWMEITTRSQAEAETYHGISLHRDEGDIPNGGKDADDDLHLFEMRCGFAIISTTFSRLPLYTMVVIWDKDQPLQTRLDVDVLLTGNAIPETYRIGCLSGLSQLTRIKRRDLMFDDAQFSKSDEYFAVLQILHTSTDWIKGVTSDLQTMQMALNHMLLTQIAYFEKSEDPEQKEEQQELAKAQPFLDSVFAHVIAEYEKQAQPILSRIERKMEEIKGLRDGLFNATSVREAARGTSLAENSSLQNRYILVFTVATILYLPMGFVTSWYGMNWFTPDSVSSASKTPFIIVFVVVSMATYIVAACGLWFVHDWESWRSMNDIRDSIRRLL